MAKKPVAKESPKKPAEKAPMAMEAPAKAPRKRDLGTTSYDDGSPKPESQKFSVDEIVTKLTSIKNDAIESIAMLREKANSMPHGGEAEMKNAGMMEDSEDEEE